MISQPQIVRLIEAQEYRHLIDRILANGRCRSAAARRVLMRPECAAVAALGLALQRLCEITYRPTPAAQMLAQQLIALQRDDGTFGDPLEISAESSLAATAVALRGLIAHASQIELTGAAAPESITTSIEDGVNALASQYHSMNDHGVHAVDWAIVLWQLGETPHLRDHVPVDHLLTMLDETATDLIEDDLCRYAHAMAA